MSGSTSLRQRAKAQDATTPVTSLVPETVASSAAVGRHPTVRSTNRLTPEQELMLSIYARAKLDAAGDVGWRWTSRRDQLQADGIRFMDDVHELLGYPPTVEVSDLCLAVVRICQRRQAQARANPRYLSACRRRPG